MEEKVLDDWEEDPEKRRVLGQGPGAGVKLVGTCWELLVGDWSKRGGPACSLCAAKLRDKALSDCCDLRLVFRGREKFSTTMMGSVGVACRLSTGDSKFETGDNRASCSCCLESSGNLRISACEVSDSGDSGMKGLDDKPGKADRGGCLCVGVDSALILGAGGKCEMVGVGLGHGLAGRL
jgi:hypothetical protein